MFCARKQPTKLLSSTHAAVSCRQRTPQCRATNVRRSVVPPTYAAASFHHGLGEKGVRRRARACVVYVRPACLRCCALLFGAVLVHSPGTRCQSGCRRWRQGAAGCSKEGKATYVLERAVQHDPRRGSARGDCRSSRCEPCRKRRALTDTQDTCVQVYEMVLFFPLRKQFVCKTILVLSPTTSALPTTHTHTHTHHTVTDYTSKPSTT